MLQTVHNRSLSVGNRTIDSGHQKLVGIINDIGQLILVEHAVALSVAIKTLNDGLQDCFAVEENIAHTVNFDFTKHKLAHQTLLNNIRVITDKLISKNGKLSKLERKFCIDYLNELLIQHIQVESMPLKIVLDTYLYDFKPEEADSPEDHVFISSSADSECSDAAVGTFQLRRTNYFNETN